MSFLYRKTKWVIHKGCDLPLEESHRQSPGAIISNTVVLLGFQHSPAQTPTTYLPGPQQEGHVCESSGLPSTPYRCKNHCMQRKEHFLDWGSPDIFPNRTSERSFRSSELYPNEGE